MHVAIEASCLQNRRGFGRFLREVLPPIVALHPEHTFTALVDHEPDPAGLPARLGWVRAHPARPVATAAIAHGRRTIAEMRTLTAAFRAIPADVYWYPAVYSFFPAPRGRPVVVTFHDTIAEQFPRLVFPNRRSEWAWAIKVRWALYQSTRILTVSEAAKRDLVSHFRLDPNRVDVTTEGPGEIFGQPVPAAAVLVQRRHLGLPPGTPYFLSVGGLSPHKNLKSLLPAFAQVAARSNAHLVIAGDPAAAGFFSEGAALFDAAARSIAKERIHFAGFVPDSDLPALYAGACALVFPSLAEGFGLPAVEAMSEGIPVLASRRGALPEVVGPAGLLFDPLNPEEIAESMLRLLNEAGLRDALASQARAHAATFTWSKSAQLVVASLVRAIEPP